jgi:glycosyltransferase involved in cell wall biosynthesis
LFFSFENDFESQPMDISIVVPLYNEEESLPELVDWIDRVMNQHKFSFEIVLVDDGSTDQSWNVVEDLSKTRSYIRGIKFSRNYGKSAALNSGFLTVKGDVVITMDADLQDSPDEIPDLFRMVKTDGFDVVSGWKKKRYDPLSKTIPTKIYNATLRSMSGIKLHDFNCGLKAYKRQVVKSIEVYGEMHRYIPYMAKKAGFRKIGEKVVLHQKRKYGVTKFGLERFINGPLDLISIMFISKFGKRPMHFFGSMGTIMFILGFIWAAFLGLDKLYSIYIAHEPARLVTTSPTFYLALTAMIIGTQLFLAGFLGELVSRSASDRNTYLIDKTIN